jgi:hypothetical protein
MSYMCHIHVQAVRLLLDTEMEGGDQSELTMPIK